MRADFKCVRIQRFDGEKPKIGPDGQPITKAVIEDGVARKVYEMEPDSIYVVEFTLVGGFGGAGKLELSRQPSSHGFVEGQTYTFNIGG